MTDLRERLSREAENLKRIRDELRVQLHLGREEARERFEQAEKRWEHLEAKLKALGHESQESMEEVGEAAQGLLHEIAESYRRIRRSLS